MIDENAGHANGESHHIDNNEDLGNECRNVMLQVLPTKCHILTKKYHYESML
jgi:hypothetical protein